MQAFSSPGSCLRASRLQHLAPPLRADTRSCKPLYTVNILKRGGVSAALVEAENQGDLQGDRWETTSGESLHVWRAERIAETMVELDAHLNRTGPPMAAASATHILLLNELAWLDITYDGKRIAVSKTQTFGPGKDGVIVFTTRRLIDNLLDGTISWRPPGGRRRVRD